MTEQLDMLAALAPAGLCDYGQPRVGESRPCNEPATHGARWAIPPTYSDGTPCSRAGTGGIDCCLDHANYYASAWAPYYPAEPGAAWLEVLVPGRAVADAHIVGLWRWEPEA